MSAALAAFLGGTIGLFGTLIGAGGGFLLVPILLFLLPGEPPHAIVAFSMLAVCANAFSGSLQYTIRGQFHGRSAILFTLFALPGTWIGTRLTSEIERAAFEGVFGALLLAIAIFLFARAGKRSFAAEESDFSPTRRALFAGSAASLLIGGIAGFVGIGGGIIHVPLLTEALGYPVHLATGTSHLILAFTSFVAVLEHFHSGHYASLPDFAPALLLGVVCGAQVGARISKRVSSRLILRALALALAVAGARFLLQLI